jgi:threonine dehydrogenase-like Zn-dependent dehydrogenase
MRQLIMNMGGVVVANMPRPVAAPGTVLIRVRYSLVSVGTEVAPLRPASVSAPDTPAIERNLDRARLLKQYLAASVRDPRKAMRRLSQIADRRLSRARQAAAATVGAAPSAASASVSDTNAQGWAIGYSLAGEVVAVGFGVADLAGRQQSAHRAQPVHHDTHRDASVDGQQRQLHPGLRPHESGPTGASGRGKPQPG